MMSTMMEKLTQAIGVGEIVTIGMSGNFFRITEALFPVNMIFMQGGRRVGSFSGMEAGDYVRDVSFDSFWMENPLGGQSVTFQISSGGAGTDRVIGEVRTTNNVTDSVYAGREFALQRVSAVVAANYSYTILNNPAASGKDFIIKRVVAYGKVASHNEIAVGLRNMGGGAAFPGYSKLGIAGPAPVGTVSAYYDALGLAGVSCEYARMPNPTALVASEFVFDPPIVLREGNGLLVMSGKLATELSVNYQWTEVPTP